MLYVCLYKCMFKLNTIIFFIVLSVNFSRDGMRYLPGNELSIKTIHYESRDLQWEIQCVLEFIFFPGNLNHHSNFHFSTEVENET